MDLRRLRAGEWIAGISGLVLLVALFLPWYGDGAGSRTGWESLGALDVDPRRGGRSRALAIPVVTALERVPAVPLAHQSLTTLVGMRRRPARADPRSRTCPTGRAGATWGCGSASPPRSGIVAGGLIAMRDERLSRRGTGTPT